MAHNLMYNSEADKQLLLNESFYNERTKEGEFSSVKVPQQFTSKVRPEVHE
jgi:hypothetical protein